MTYPSYYDTMAYIISLIDEERVHMGWESECGVGGRDINNRVPYQSTGV